MARSIVLGNGNILVCFDHFGQVRDFYYPYVGQENHVGQNQVHKIGVFCEDNFHWVDDGSWNINSYYGEESMVSVFEWQNTNMEIGIKSKDIVYNEANILLRKYQIQNLSKRSREVKFYTNQQFKISDTNHADTAYYSSSLESVIHYKGRRVFLVGGFLEDKSFDDYSIGFNGVLGKEGTWKDAEDGKLSQNSIEHGQVDSVLGWNFYLEPGETKELYYWVIVGETYREVDALRKEVIEKSCEHIIESTTDFWHAWVMQTEVKKVNISQKALSLFRNSLFVMKTHTDNNGGILASGDAGNIQYGGDTYAYIWPRDACFGAWVFDMAGFGDISKRFYDFAHNILTDDGYVLHKYQPDKSLGSSWHPWVQHGHKQLAIQEDETAILLVGLWEHYIRHKDLEFIEALYNPFIKKIAEFLIYFKDKETSLPFSSYDLWEERYGVSVFTSSVVYAALVAAHNFAKILGKDDDSRNFTLEAEKVRRAIISNFWDPSNKYFFGLIEKDTELVKDERVDLSSFYGVFRFGVLPCDDPRMQDAFLVIKSRLVSGNMGFVRYEGDKYNQDQSNVNTPGNPWVITTMWVAQYLIALAKIKEDLDYPKALIEWVSNVSDGSVLPEQLDPYTNAFISATPLMWSHAEYVRSIIELGAKIEKNTEKKDDRKF